MDSGRSEVADSESSARRCLRRTRGNHMLVDVGNADVPPLGKFTADRAAGLVTSFQQDRPLYSVDPQLSSLRSGSTQGLPPTTLSKSSSRSASRTASPS